MVVVFIAVAHVAECNFWIFPVVVIHPVVLAITTDSNRHHVSRFPFLIFKVYAGIL
jgi:hypothetical protein